MNENYFPSLQSHSDVNFHIFCVCSERTKRREKNFSIKASEVLWWIMVSQLSETLKALAMK